MLAVNDRTADGTDISWLDEADFGMLARRGKIMRVYVCGDRAEAAEKGSSAKISPVNRAETMINL